MGDEQKPLPRAKRASEWMRLCSDAVLLAEGGRVVDANDPALALIGADARQALHGLTLSDLFPANRDGAATPTLRRFDGSNLPVEAAVASLSSDSGADTMLILRKVSAAPPTQQEQKKPDDKDSAFEALVKNIPDAVCRIDRRLRHLYVNPAMEAMTGRPAAQLAGQDMAALGFPEDVARTWSESVRAVFSSGAGQRFDFRLRRDQEQCSYAVRLVPETGADGRVESVLGIVYDTRERTRMEDEHKLLLERERASRIQAETAARARDEFLGLVSHELRAPLNGIQTWAHVLENYVKDTGALAKRAIAGIRTGIDQQVRLIEDLLDATRLLSGRLRLAMRPFMLLPVVRAAVESVRPDAAMKKISIHCSYALADEEIQGDSDRIQQVLWNLLHNAVKFTPEGGNIWINANAAGGAATVSVRDDGTGIAREFLPYLFDRFSQRDSSSTRGHTGLGLGLFLVRNLVEMHGGTATVDSRGEGHGAVFTVRLPLREQARRSAPPPQLFAGEAGNKLPSLAGLRILLVDDQQDVREALGILLSNAGASVFSAASSQEIFSWLSTLKEEELPDILICDIAMPTEDGYTVLRKLRAWKSAGGAPLHKMPALALTAFTQREDRIKALTAGFQMHMAKPVSPEELIVVIAMMTTKG